MSVLFEPAWTLVLFASLPRTATRILAIRAGLLSHRGCAWLT